MFVALAIVLVAVAALAHTAPAPFLLEAHRPRQSIWHMRRSPGQAPALFLTFDDGPNVVWTPALLDALRDVGARATFFLIDAHITPESEPVVRRIADEGHAIALHSGTRRLMLMSPDGLARHLQTASDRIARLTARRPCPMFRPHAGWRSSTMYEGLQRAGFTLVGWSWGMWDWDWWRRPEGAAVAAKILRKASPGDIIVIHDGHHANPVADRRHASDAVRLLVPPMRERGFSFDVLCEMAPAAASMPMGHGQ